VAEHPPITAPSPGEVRSDAPPAPSGAGRGSVLSARGLHHGYEGQEVLRGVDLEVPRGRRVGLIGPSGCGKSTLLRLLGLLERPDAGHVEVAGIPVSGAGTALPATVRRRVQLLWQAPRAAADPRRTLRQLIGDALRFAGRDDAEPVSDELASRVGLTPDLVRRHPHEVSDGQLQRACLARALAPRPDVLLCDELGSMLDVSTQASLLAVLETEQAERDLAVVLVSHDRALLRHWCDPVHELRDGRIRSPSAASCRGASPDRR
jgi:ABC-type dipeptide/oligopeptide/nickel transport system ATPase subunit